MMQTYVRVTEVYAAQLEKETKLYTSSGIIMGQKGDYLVMEDGVPSIMSKALFEKNHFHLAKLTAA